MTNSGYVVTLAGMTMKIRWSWPPARLALVGEYGQFYPIDDLGGICVKGLTLHRREWQSSSQNCRDTYGHPNSVGLENPA